MKKFTFLFLLTAFIAVNVFGQTPTLKTNPVMDSNNEVTIIVDNNNGVIASIENSVSDQSYILIQSGPAEGIIETIKGNGSADNRFDDIISVFNKGNYTLLPELDKLSYLKS